MCVLSTVLGTTNLCTSKINYKLLISPAHAGHQKHALDPFARFTFIYAYSLLLIDSKSFGSIYCGNAQTNAG